MTEQKLGNFEALKAGGVNGGTVYQIYVTEQRIMALKTGSQLEGGKAFTVHLGALGALIGYFLDKRVQKKRAALRESFEQKSLDELLLLDAKNFEVRFDALEGAEVKRSKLGFLAGNRANLVLRKMGEKPLELALNKDIVRGAVDLLERALPGRLQADPKLKG
jgi:hypothetical protein